MRTKPLLFFTALALGLNFSNPSPTHAQTNAPAPRVELPSPSPASTLKQRVGLTDIEIVYSRPSMKGRAIFGSLVPYGKVWRTGANAPTKITTSTAIKIGGKDLPAGSYTLHTIPGETEWTIIINKGGSNQYDEKADVLRFTVTPVKLADAAVETFTIEFNQLRDNSAELYLLWEKTYVPIKIELNLTASLVPEIEAVMAAAGGQKPYYPAALFYFENGQDLAKASKWVDAAIAQREAHYMVHLKARILAKLGDKAGATAAAKRSSELAEKANDPGYLKMNQDLIASLK